MWAEHIFSSTAKVFLGWVISLVIGLSLAVARFFLPEKLQNNYFFNLLIDLVRFPPPIAWIPFVIMYWGASFYSSITIVIIGGMPPFFTLIYDCLRSTEIKFRQLCNTLQISKMKSVFRIFLPSQWNRIYTGARISLGMCWMSIVASEMISSQSGIGYLIQMHRINLDYQMVLLDIFIIALCGYCMNQLLHYVEKKHLVWLQ